MSIAGKETTDVLTDRLAVRADLEELRTLIERAIDELQRPFLSEEQVVASRRIMGVDTMLIDDGTYFVVEEEGRIVGCGGWSPRATLFGADHMDGRSLALLDPATDAAKIRAMYTHPDAARRGVGRRILQRCQSAAADAGFRRLELMATMSGRPLYTAAGFSAVEDVVDTSTGVAIPLTRMVKQLP